MKSLRQISFVWLAAVALGATAAEKALEPLRVSENRRFLVTQSGQPFFWLGDTSWHMFGKSARAVTDNQLPVSLYFSNRAAKGFTVIQSVIARWPDGGSSANAYGFEPFESGDWSRPRLKPGLNDDYWDHVDYCIAEAKRHGIYIAGLPMWLSAIEENHSMTRDPRVAYRYGHFLGARYGKEPHMIWVLGGDAWQKGRNVDRPERLAMIRAQAEGIADGAIGVDQFDGQADWRAALMTFHPPGGNHSSSEWLHAEPWLDFNMIQTTTRFSFENWRTVAKDYALEPPKPTLDAEVAYEDSLSLRKTEPQDRRIRPWDSRRAAYWNMFAGGFGHTYGHRSFIGWIRRGETYNFGAHIPWYESLDAPGAFQMGHLRRLIESRPFLTRVPDPSVIVGDPLAADEHLQATRDSGGTYAMVYSPSGRPIKVRMNAIAGPKAKAWWFDPRTGQANAIGEFPSTADREFAPPTSGPENDWVLVLDDAAKDFPPPGQAGDRAYTRADAGAVGRVPSRGEVEDTGSNAGSGDRAYTGAGVGAVAAPFKTIQVGTRPESVTKGFGEHYYVTVMGGQEPGDGGVHVIKGGQVERFAGGMDEPKGIAFVGGFLVTTDLKRVWKIDASGNKTVLAEEKDFPMPIRYLNDTAAAPNGRGVYVADMGARDKINGPDGLWPVDSPEARSLPHVGRIYSIGLDGRVRLAVDAAPEMPCPNGVCAPARNRLLIAEFFFGNILEARKGRLTTLNTGFRGADGIECASTGEIIVSSWTQGKVWKLDAGGRNPKVLIEGLQSAADFYLDEPARLLLVPDMKAGAVLFVPWE